MPPKDQWGLVGGRGARIQVVPTVFLVGLRHDTHEG